MKKAARVNKSEVIRDIFNKNPKAPTSGRTPPSLQSDDLFPVFDPPRKCPRFLLDAEGFPIG